MARRRFFVESVRRGVAEITGEDANHLVRVLRVEPGQIFELSDNTRVYLAEVETARKSEVVFRVREELMRAAAGPHLTLCAALIKFDRFEWLIEKATELGVSRIEPFTAVRSEHGLINAAQKRLERWRKIGLEASQQSRRDQLPQIEPAVRSIRDVGNEADVRVFLDEESKAPVLTQLPPFWNSAAILLGPEGGWTSEERSIAVDNGWLSCTLGRSILRAETAGIAGLAILGAAWRPA